MLYQEPTCGCWLYIGNSFTPNGFGKTYWKKARRVIHRAVWEFFLGAICPTFVLDHKCRVRICANPAHLDPVTSDVNTARGLVALFRKPEEYAPSF